MLFITTLDVIPGKARDFLDFLKSFKVPDDVKIHQFLELFGKPDFAIIYEAPDENTAVDFVLQFCPYATPKTSLCNPIKIGG